MLIRNNKGECISISGGGTTTDWFEASKFPESEYKFNKEVCEQILKMFEYQGKNEPYFKGYKPQIYFNTNK